jgi:hypothetical protein
MKIKKNAVSGIQLIPSNKAKGECRKLKDFGLAKIILQNNKNSDDYINDNLVLK